jgi:glycosyltransferase involved in cell wall biosynthesis
MAVDPVVTSPAEVFVEPLAGPQIDVVITNHNYNRYVPGAVASALSQRGVLTRVIVVDDGSDEPLGGFEGEPRVRVLRRDVAGGVGMALNAGVAAGSAALVALLDADDLWPRNHCQILAKALGDADMAYGAQVIFADGDQPDLDPASEQVAALGEVPAVPLPGTTLLRRSLLERVGPFSEVARHGAFIGWMVQARAARPPVREIVVNLPVLLRRAHTTNMTRTNRQVGDYFAAVAQRRRLRTE